MDYALKLQQEAYLNDDVGSHQRAADALEVAADSLEETGQPVYAENYRIAAAKQRREIDRLQETRFFARKHLTLAQAAAHARSRKLLGNYYALDRDTVQALVDLMKRTFWRQSRSSRAQGHGRTYAFHQALVRASSRGSR